MEKLSINDLKEMGVDIPETREIKNPNVQNETRGIAREVNPAEMLGLKSQRELDQENPDLVPEEVKIYDKIDSAMDKKVQEVLAIQEIYDQTDGEVTIEDLNDVLGFNPDELLANPPTPGRIKSLKAELPEEEKNKLRVANAVPEPIKYENDTEIDEDELLEQEILEAIPDVEEIQSPVVKSTQPIIKQEEIDMDKPVNNSDVIPKIPTEKPEVERSEDDDLLALDSDIDDSDEDEITKERMELLKDDVKKKIKPSKVAFDLSGFRIVNKPIGVNATLGQSNIQNARVADWPLFYSERLSSMKEFKGKELELLVSSASGRRNQSNAIHQQYQTIYDHIVDPFKPADLESWAKVTSIMDVDSLYANAYIASFEGNNYLPYDCPNKKCNNTFLSNDVPFMDMVKFKNDGAKVRFNKVLNSVQNETHKEYKSELIPISDTYAMEFKEPSIYDAIFEPSYLDPEFIQKYNDVIGIYPYIDGIYFIDIADRSIRPLNIKKFPNDKVKTIKAKIITLSKIIKELTADQYGLLTVYASNITGSDTDSVSFVLPETHCPKCGERIKEVKYTAAELLFLRHHLTNLING